MNPRLFGTATRALRTFVPLHPGRVSIYVCSATVQSGPHIGHLRLAVAFDQLWRWLEAGHGYDVTSIRNITGLDDKVLAASRETDIEFDRTTLTAASRAGSRIEKFMYRAAQDSPGAPSTRTDEADRNRGPQIPEAFRHVRDDDLDVPAALAVVHEPVRDGNAALDRADSEGLTVIGTPDGPSWRISGQPGPTYSAWKGNKDEMIWEGGRK